MFISSAFWTRIIPSTIATFWFAEDVADDDTEPLSASFSLVAGVSLVSSVFANFRRLCINLDLSVHGNIELFLKLGLASSSCTDFSYNAKSNYDS